MRSPSRVAVLGPSGALAVLLVACSSSTPAPALGEGGSGGSTTMSSSTVATSGAGGRAPGPCEYPAGPYGTSVGDTMPPSLTWQGYAENAAEVSTLSIADYFDCDGSSGIDALLVETCVAWIGGCTVSAEDIGQKAAAWKAEQIHVLALLMQNAEGDDATTDDAQEWSIAYDLGEAAVAADPQFVLAPSTVPGFPYDVTVDPRTMKIVTIQQGYTGNFDPLENLASQN